MRIATWNVNSIRARLDHVVDWLLDHQPDVLALQELKVVDEDFPAEALQEAGYRSVAYGQKTYNGVAILAREPIEDVRRGFDDGAEEDPQARIVRGTVGGVRIVNVYVVNGKEVGDEKYHYKLAWLDRLRAMLHDQESPDGELVLLGDFNICPEPRDTWDAEKWEGRVFCTEEERRRFRAFLDWGLVDTLRSHDDRDGLFTWWDYRGLSYQRRKGLRIDHILASKSLAERSTACVVDRVPRKRKRPSDHAPVLATFDG